MGRHSPANRGPEVVFQPKVYQSWQQGINTLVEAIRPTLGPLARKTVVMDQIRPGTLELLDDGGSIARRITQLSDRDADMGAMFLRQMLWKVHEEVGDGTATAAVVFQRIYNEGVRMVAGGYNPALLRRYLHDGLEVIVEQIEEQSRAVDGQKMLSDIAASLTIEPALALALGDIFNKISYYGRLEIRQTQGREIRHEFVNGGYWDRQLFSSEQGLETSALSMEVKNAAFVISDLDLDQPQQLYAALQLAVHESIPGLIIFANHVSEQVVNFLSALRMAGKYSTCVVKTPGNDPFEQAAFIHDVAALTGGIPLIREAGSRLEAVKPENFGRADLGWTNREFIGIVGGKARPEDLEKHLLMLALAYEDAEKLSERRRIRSRIGNLLIQSATLWVGGATEAEIKYHVAEAERAAEVVRAAMREGVVAGGGAALLSCRSGLL
ncbi:MAG: hypothetical protein EHM70_23610, partial [Chloroflexota bacterium]